MLPCNEVRELAEEYVSGELELPRRREVGRHLRICPSCHRAVEEARLAQIVLQEADTPLPPPRLADRIKRVAFTRLTYRPRPLHERALGSPAFLATCASLLCGAIICLVAILQVASVRPWPTETTPRVEVVARFRLPSRNLRAATIASAVVHHRRADAPRGVERRNAPALMTVSAPRAAPPRPRPSPPPSARYPQRALTASASPPPTMAQAPTLPNPELVLAGMRTSRPDLGQAAPPPAAPTPELTPVAAGGEDWLDWDDLLAPTAPVRGDFTSARDGN